MKRIQTHSETLVYVVSWLLILLSPLVIEGYNHLAGTDAFTWGEVIHAWVICVPFLLVFIVHNWLLAPLLVVQHRRGMYLSVVTLVILLFTLYECTQRPFKPQHEPHSRHEQMYAPHEPPSGFHHDAEHPLTPHPQPFGAHKPEISDHGKPPFIALPELMAILMMVFMLGMNIAVKYYFSQREDSRRVDELERRYLEQQLSQLRYQLNPHFLMNALNNIHALIDINPQEAQQSLVELSRLLRFVLYDADSALVPLRRDLEFMQHYIALMRVRYADSVRIDVQLPDPVPDVDVPSLLFIAFVENAFKHGVSYQDESFVEITVSVSADHHELTFTCRNKKHEAAVAEHEAGGVGLRNVRQRLDLLYANHYQLDINDATSIYDVRLVIPLTPISIDSHAPSLSHR